MRNAALNSLAALMFAPRVADVRRSIESKFEVPTGGPADMPQTGAQLDSGLNTKAHLRFSIPSASSRTRMQAATRTGGCSPQRSSAFWRPGGGRQNCQPRLLHGCDSRDLGKVLRYAGG